MYKIFVHLCLYITSLLVFINFSNQNSQKKNDRTKSLFEVHSEKLKKKRRRSSSSSSDRSSKKHKKKDKKNKKVEREPTRRPFDRNVDLQTVNLLDTSQRQALMKRSKELNTKFMHGKSHYL